MSYSINCEKINDHAFEEDDYSTHLLAHNLINHGFGIEGTAAVLGLVSKSISRTYI